MAIILTNRLYRFPNIATPIQQREYKDPVSYRAGTMMRLRVEVMDFPEAVQLTVFGRLLDTTRPQALSTLVKTLFETEVADDFDPLDAQFVLADDPPFRFFGPGLWVRIAAPRSTSRSRFNLSLTGSIP